jgi:hypothetical protein
VRVRGEETLDDTVLVRCSGQPGSQVCHLRGIDVDGGNRVAPRGQRECGAAGRGDTARSRPSEPIDWGRGARVVQVGA